MKAYNYKITIPFNKWNTLITTKSIFLSFAISVFLNSQVGENISLYYLNLY